MTRDAYSQNDSQARTLTLWASSRARPAALLRPGSDLVLEIASADGIALADGVAVDDYLGSEARVSVDRECRERYRSWRARRARALTVEGVDLTHIWEVELIAQCFLPAARLRHGLGPALVEARAERLLTRRLDPGVTQLAAAVAEPMGVEVTAAAQEIVEREPVPRKASSRLGCAAETLGVRSYVRGEVLSVAYWHILPLLAGLARRRGGPRIVASPLPVRDIGAASAVLLAARGGWTGVPGARARADARAVVAATLRAADGADSTDPVDAALDRHALETLQRLSLDTLAHVRHARRALARGNVRLGLLPFDSPEQARMLLGALSEAGAGTLLVQHGFSGRLGDPDMRSSDHLAIWSERDRPPAGRDDHATITVTGNPGVCHLADIAPSRPRQLGRSVVLVDYPGRLSASVASRVSMRHVAAALEALASVRPGSVAVVRPHPADLEPDAYMQLASAHPQLRVEVDGRSPIETLLAGADLCVGTLSTATLQACALGLPTVFLDVSGIPRPWPFDGNALLSVADADALAEAIASMLRSNEVVGRDAAVDALGVRPDAIERVIALIVDLSR